MLNRGALAGSILAATALIGAGCDTRAAGGTTPSVPTTTAPTAASVNTAPVIGAFTAAAPGTAPALVPVSWSVSDPEGDVLTCRIDGDGDGTFEHTIKPCAAKGVRNVSIPTARSVTARLQVSDGALTTTATHVMAVDPGPAEPFNITIRYAGTVAPAVTTAVGQAVARWEKVVVRGVPSVDPSPYTPCVDKATPYPSEVDDVLIEVAVQPQDGAGGVLAVGGACLSRGGGATAVGLVILDSADVPAMVANGTLLDVITHEVGHALGIGVLWNGRKLLSGTSSDRRMTGARSMGEWQRLGGSGTVPTDAGGGHWRESTFGLELMTPFLGARKNPLSRLSVAGLADLGYHVDINAADSFSLGGGVSAQGLFTQTFDAHDHDHDHSHDVLVEPIAEL